jgi:hypothetical protein
LQKAKKHLIVHGLVRYYVNLGYEKFVEQFVMHELYNELKVEFVIIKVSVLYHYPYLFKSQQVSVVTNLGLMVLHVEHENIYPSY